VTSRNQGLSSNDQGMQRRETLATRLITMMMMMMMMMMMITIIIMLYQTIKAVINCQFLAYIVVFVILG